MWRCRSHRATQPRDGVRAQHLVRAKRGGHLRRLLLSIHRAAPAHPQRRHGREAASGWCVARARGLACGRATLLTVVCVCVCAEDAGGAVPSLVAPTRRQRAVGVPSHTDVGRATDLSFPTVGDTADGQTCAATLCRLFKIALTCVTRLFPVRRCPSRGRRVRCRAPLASPSCSS
jgi:hypothetical protein